MNIKGIQLLLSLKLPSPRKEVIFKDFIEVDLNNLYEHSSSATIMAFDNRIPITHNPINDTPIRTYGIPRDAFAITFNKLKRAFKIPEEHLLFVAHESYFPETISHSGRILIISDKEILIEAVASLRKGNTTFTPTFAYRCPIKGNTINRSEEQFLREETTLPKNILNQIITDTQGLPGNPCIDFCVYKDNGELFYHDLFLAKEV